ncbi:MAG TPA: hypothetical protein VK639_15355 [Terriglobales bacterium]|nr:hypothetical protein [Terriglobales bacterium]
MVRSKSGYVPLSLQQLTFKLKKRCQLFVGGNDESLFVAAVRACCEMHANQSRHNFVTDAHRGDSQRFIVRADEKLSAFMELESVICICGELS